MGWDAGLKLRRAIENARTVVAIEALCAAQALDLRAPLEASEATRAVTTAIRERVPTLTEDRPLAPDIEAVTNMVRVGALVRAAEIVIGPQPWQVP
jgi:histidine ammonia-lyase